jgi:uncharacterized protein
MSASPAFRARWPWFGADLQTLRNFIIRPRPLLPHAGPTERLELPLDDGTGDRLLVLADRPLDARAGRGSVMLVHGLSGCSESFYMLATAAALLAAGHVVLRVNLRGAGAGFALARGSYHAGASREIAAVLAGLPAALTANGVAAIGYSLGGNVLLKHLADSGSSSGLTRAVSVSAPIDLAAASMRIRARRNAVYHRYLLSRMIRDARRRGAALPPAQRAALDALRDIRDFDDRIVAPLNGFAGADDYYRRSSTATRLHEIETPTLLIHARDDPWIPVAMYDAVPWSALRAARVLLPPRGGHLGFHDASSPVAWHDRAILACLDPGADQPRSVSAASSAK